MKKYLDFTHFKGDLFGGITAAIVALPLALAFGMQSGLGAIAGLYGAIVLGFFAAILGGTAIQISGPTGPMTVVSAIVVSSAVATMGSLHAGMGMIIAIFLLAGACQVLFGLLRIGKHIKYIPFPVVSGFMTGIGVIIILYQLYPLLGYSSPKDTVSILMNIGTPLATLNWSAVILGLGTLLIIYLFPKITTAIPSILVALIASTLAAYLLKLNVPVIGNIPTGLPQLQLSTLTAVKPDTIWLIIEYAATLAALGAIDSLLTSVIADNITKTKHRSNRELIGQGVGNMLSASVGGLPGAGATLRTVINANAGGKTRLSGVIHSLILLAILLELGQFAAYIPLSVLAAILLTVGIGIVDYRSLRHLSRVPKTDAAILIIVLLLTVFFSLLHAVGVGVLLACVLFMKQASDLVENQSTVHAVTHFENEDPWDDESSVYNQYQGKIYIKHLNGPLFFGFTSRFQELMTQIDSNVQVLMIRMENVPYMDQSGLYALEEAIYELQQKDVVVLLIGIRQQPLNMLKKIDIIPALVPDMHAFDTFADCTVWLKHNLKSEQGGFDSILEELKATRKNKANYRL